MEDCGWATATLTTQIVQMDDFGWPSATLTTHFVHMDDFGCPTAALTARIVQVDDCGWPTAALRSANRPDGRPRLPHRHTPQRAAWKHPPMAAPDSDTADRLDDLVIPARFCGPPRSANGGFTAGALAERLPNPRIAVEVTLRRPPPLKQPLQVERLDDEESARPRVRLTSGGHLVAEATAATAELFTVPAVTPSQAEVAMAAFAGLRSHPFPSCFSCGTDREEGDGLRIFPGPVPSDAEAPHRVAATWVPDASLTEPRQASGAASGASVEPPIPEVGSPTAWAALDCVGGWSGDLEGRRMVLGRMTAQVDTLPVVGETYVVVGLMLGSEGRKTFTASTLYDAEQRVVGRAEHVWITIDPADFS